jgi:hypothetical protein
MAPLPPQNQTLLFGSLASYCLSSPFPFPHLTAILHQHQSHPYKTRNLSPLGSSVVITPSAANLGRDLRQHALSKPLAWGAESVRFAFAAVQACEVPQIKSSYHIDIGLDFMVMIEMDLCLLRDAQKIIGQDPQWFSGPRSVRVDLDHPNSIQEGLGVKIQISMDFVDSRGDWIAFTHVQSNPGESEWRSFPQKSRVPLDGLGPSASAHRRHQHQPQMR